MDRLNRSILVVLQLGVLDCTTVVDTLTELTVVIEQIPLAVILYDRVVSRPTDNRLHDSSTIGERSVRCLRRCVYEIVSRTG